MKICSVYDKGVITGPPPLFWGGWHLVMSWDQNTGQTSRFFKRIGGIHLAPKHLKISTWSRHIPIQYVPSLEKEISKLDIWILNVLRRIRKIVYPQWQVIFQGKEIKSFSILQVIKSGSFMKILNAKKLVNWEWIYSHPKCRAL